MTTLRTYCRHLSVCPCCAATPRMLELTLQEHGRPKIGTPKVSTNPASTPQLVQFPVYMAPLISPVGSHAFQGFCEALLGGHAGSSIGVIKV